MGIIIFNGISSMDYGIQVETRPDYETPEKDYDVIHVPGKNGDVVVDMGSYRNVGRAYNIVIGSLEREFTPMANDISEWLHSTSGYARLEDSYEPDYYRLAIFKDSGVINNIYGRAGRTSISFDCKPQRFLKVGDQTINVQNGESLINPTGFQALPIITIKGSGSGLLIIGDYSISISSIDSEIIINSEVQDVYKGLVNKNSSVSLANGFPKLIAGSNNVLFSGGVTSVEVIPKWWTI